MKENEALTATQRTIPPACSIFEQDEGVVLQLEMPGVSKDNIDIKIEKDNLIITGNPHISQEKGSILLAERRSGTYRKNFTIDERIDRDRIDAVMANGVLTLGLNFREIAKPRQIKIKGPAD